jgi:hypothetical protein
MGFEPINPMFKPAKTVRVLDRAATVIASFSLQKIKFQSVNYLFKLQFKFLNACSCSQATDSWDVSLN